MNQLDDNWITYLLPENFEIIKYLDIFVKFGLFG